MFFICFVFYGLFGAVTGSFLNVCILRIPENQNFVTGRSHCPACGHVLAFYDMVPVLSWLFLKGRCRYCRASISVQYPAVELLTASAFILCLLSKGPGMDSALMCMFSGILITAAFIDTRHMYIPDGIHILILLLSCISLAAGSGPTLMNRLGGSLLAGGFLALVNLLSRGGVGWGDVKLFAASGLLIGAAPAMTALLMGYVIARLWYAVPLFAGKSRPKDTDTHGTVFRGIPDDMWPVVWTAASVVSGLFPLTDGALPLMVSRPHNSGIRRFRSDKPSPPVPPLCWTGTVCG
ncbi:MAG: prepilin peptidase [Clostridia bacterium]|nr:prepilin peptidase [Clostridia bacterium]